MKGLLMAHNGTPLLMLIDDEPAQRRLIAALAARAGWRTIFANDGETAIAMLGTHDGMRLDAILLDHWIPDFDTSRLINDIRERRTGLPILILTSHNHLTVAGAAMRAVATAFHSTPITPARPPAALPYAVNTSSLKGEPPP